MIRNCPECKKEIVYKNKISFNRAIKMNKKCQHCCKIGINNFKFRKKHPMLGKNHSQETKNKIRDNNIGKKKKMPLTHSLNVSKSLINNKRNKDKHYIRTDEQKKKMRLAALNRIIKINGRVQPSFNINACKIIDEYGKQNGYNFQHALNGGEFNIKELGYWVDGYDKEKNTVIEYYEKSHHKKINRDKKRKDEIINFLKCKFIELYEGQNK